MEMLYAGVMEKDLKMLEKNLNKLTVVPEERKYFDKIIADMVQVLNQNGYEKCSEIIHSLLFTLTSL